jgi:hypothetical protein
VCGPVVAPSVIPRDCGTTPEHTAFDPVIASSHFECTHRTTAGGACHARPRSKIFRNYFPATGECAKARVVLNTQQNNILCENPYDKNLRRIKIISMFFNPFFPASMV